MFAAVMLFMTGVALQFHFGQYVEYVGYGTGTLGRILSISMVGTLLIRLHIGRWIDRLGCRPTWLAGTAIVAVTVGSIQFTQNVWLIIALRTLSTMATAAVMTTVAVFAAQIAPPGRRAESLGMIGLAGFTGMIVGPTLGDWIFSASTDVITPYRIFFSASAVCSLLAGGVIQFLGPPTAGSGRDQTTAATSLSASAGFKSPRRTSPRGTDLEQCHPSPCQGGKEGGASQLRLIIEHWPGVVLLVGVVFSMVFCLQTSFLERLAEARGFKDIKVFFLVYGPTAMSLRVICRRVPERLGRSRTLFGGLVLLGTGLVFLTGVTSQWELAVPALLMGAGHCFIFPSMVDLAAERLPFEHRGTGTALILGAGDLGMLIGYGVLGELIDARGFDAGLLALAAAVLSGAGIFAFVRRRVVFSRRKR
jgi:MFS family permease